MVLCFDVPTKWIDLELNVSISDSRSQRADPNPSSSFDQVMIGAAVRGRDEPQDQGPDVILEMPVERITSRALGFLGRHGVGAVSVPRGLLVSSRAVLYLVEPREPKGPDVASRWGRVTHAIDLGNPQHFYGLTTFTAPSSQEEIADTEASGAPCRFGARAVALHCRGGRNVVLQVPATPGEGRDACRDLVNLVRRVRSAVVPSPARVGGGANVVTVLYRPLRGDDLGTLLGRRGDGQAVTTSEGERDDAVLTAVASAVVRVSACERSAATARRQRASSRRGSITATAAGLPRSPAAVVSPADLPPYRAPATDTTGGPSPLSARHGKLPDPSDGGIAALPSPQAVLDRLPVRDRMDRIYLAYCPQRRHLLDESLVRYRGMEADLLLAMVEKYGPEPPLTDDEVQRALLVANVSSPNSPAPSELSLRSRVPSRRRFTMLHGPEPPMVDGAASNSRKAAEGRNGPGRQTEGDDAEAPARRLAEADETPRLVAMVQEKRATVLHSASLTAQFERLCAIRASQWCLARHGVVADDSSGERGSPPSGDDPQRARAAVSSSQGADDDDRARVDHSPRRASFPTVSTTGRGRGALMHGRQALHVNLCTLVLMACATVAKERDSAETSALERQIDEAMQSAYEGACLFDGG